MEFDNAKSLSKDDILELWRGSGYIHFNGYLARDNYPFFSLARNTMEHNGKIYGIGSLVAKLRSVMIPYVEYRRKNIAKLGRGKIDYFRGEELTLFSTHSYIRETFISVTMDNDQSKSFNADSSCGCLFKVSINEAVYCVETGIEKELLLEPGCYWKFKGIVNEIYIIEICPHEEGVLMLNEMISQTRIEKARLQTSVLEKQSSDSLDEIEGNIELFNVADDDEYSIDDFKDDLTVLQISFNSYNIVSLFDFYKSTVKKDS